MNSSAVDGAWAFNQDGKPILQQINSSLTPSEMANRNLKQDSVRT